MADERFAREEHFSKPAEYHAPLLSRWGTLRELTEGGGGFKNEPGTGGARRTRF